MSPRVLTLVGPCVEQCIVVRMHFIATVLPGLEFILRVPTFIALLNFQLLSLSLSLVCVCVRVCFLSHTVVCALSVVLLSLSLSLSLALPPSLPPSLLL